MNIVIVIPAYNEHQAIGGVIDTLKRAGYQNIIVVDDGSSDATQSAAYNAGAWTLRHALNRGKGAAIQTGLEAAKRLQPDIVVTFDGDGQHDARDIAALTAPIIAGRCEVVLGVRLRTSMPRFRLVANNAANIITGLLYGLWVKDSQSGLRAFSRHAIAVMQTRAETYEYDSEVIREISRCQLTFQEIPITVAYTPYTRAKRHQQNLTNGLRTVYKMVWHILT